MRRPRKAAFVAAIFVTVATGGLVLANGNTADAAPFTGDNLVVYRVGDGAAALTNAGTAVFLDEVTPAGDAVQSIALPTATATSTKRLVASGLSTSEGEITRSPNGKYVTVTGYDAAVGDTGPSSTSLTASDPATVGRTVGIVDGNGTVDTSTALKGSNIPSIVRSATTA
ncbi:MAG TPA: hypothetical protein VNC41_03710, partial [Acidimicrobiia bacterium]|nr:hypothetical protein [Acidimicrobiia bacterium]